MAVYDFQAAALALPGIVRLFMMDTTSFESAIVDYSPSAVNGQFAAGLGTTSSFSNRQAPLLRRQPAKTYSFRARDPGGRTLGNYVRLNTYPNFQAKSFWHVAVVRPTRLWQRRQPVIGTLSTSAGGAGNAFALVINPNGSVSAGFHTHSSGWATSAPGVIKGPYAVVLVASYNHAAGQLQVWLDGVRIINATGLTGITNAANGLTYMGLLGNGGTTTLSAAMAEGATSVTVASAVNFSALGGKFSMKYPTLPSDPTKPAIVTYRYTGLSGTTLTGVSVTTDGGPEPAGGWASGTTVAPYFESAHDLFYGPWAIGVSASLTDAQVAAISTATGLLDKTPASVLFSRRIGWRNMALRDDIPIKADSASYVNQHLIRTSATGTASTGGLNFLNTTEYAPRIHYVTDDTPTAEVYNHHATSGNVFTFDQMMHEHFKEVPIPAGLKDIPADVNTTQLGAPGTDHEAVIWHRERGIAWEFWQVYYNHWRLTVSPPDPASYVGDGRWHCNWGGFMADMDGNQDGHYEGAGNQQFWGPTATGLHLLSGTLLVEEALAEEAHHPLTLSLTFCKSGTTSHWWPAQRNDGRGANAFDTPQGALLRLPRSVTIDATSVPHPLGRTLARTIQNYGMIVRDTVGGVPAILTAEPAANFVIAHGYDPWTGRDPDGNQAIPVADTLLEGASRSNLIPPAIWRQIVLVDPDAYKAEASIVRSDVPEDKVIGIGQALESMMAQSVSVAKDQRLPLVSYVRGSMRIP